MDVSRNLVFTFAVLILSVISAAGPSHGAELVWDSETGWSADAEAQKTEAGRLYKHGRELFVKGEMLAAMDVFEAIEQKHPGSPHFLRAKLARARCLEQLDRLDEAVRLCEELAPLTEDETAKASILDLQMAVIEKMSMSRPEHAGEMLDRMAESAPDEESRKAAQTALARIAESPPVAAPPETIPVEVVEEDLSEFYLGLEILQSCRAGMGDDERLRAAKQHFESFLTSNPRTKRDSAELCLRAIDGLLQTTEPELESVYYAMTYMPEERYAEARGILKRIAKRFPETKAGELAQFQYAESFYLEGKLSKAFHAYERLIEAYPETDAMPAIAAREFAIGEGLIDQGEAKKAIAVLEALVKNDPLGALVDDAQMYMGRAYMEREDYVAAKAAFAAIPRDFPRSEWSKAAVFFGGKADFMNAESARDREDLLSNARAAFELYLWQAPQGTFAEQARTLLQETVEQQATVLWEIARFYEKTRKHQSAAWYYGLLSRDYPDSAQAELAQAAADRYSKLGFRTP